MKKNKIIFDFVINFFKNTESPLCIKNKISNFNKNYILFEFIFNNEQKKMPVKFNLYLDKYKNTIKIYSDDKKVYDDFINSIMNKNIDFCLSVIEKSFEKIFKKWNLIESIKKGDLTTCNLTKTKNSFFYSSNNNFEIDNKLLLRVNFNRKIYEKSITGFCLIGIPLIYLNDNKLAATYILKTSDIYNEFEIKDVVSSLKLNYEIEYDNFNESKFIENVNQLEYKINKYCRKLALNENNIKDNTKEVNEKYLIYNINIKDMQVY